MTQTYTVKEWKPWKDVTDEDGNQLGSVTFEEHNNEPVDIRVKRDLQAGQQLRGEIKDSKKGRPTFFMADLDRQRIISAQWAVGQALMYCADHTDLEKLQDTAEGYLMIVERIAE